ncbi:MAG: ABC transporter substrate-binding protein, partial [Marinirhabdus sp.]
KEGMVLKIPKAAAGGAIGEIRSVSLENRIRNRDNKNLAVLLPFRLNKTTGDSVSNNQNIIKNDALMRIALDFYSGVLLAATFAKDQGIPVTLNVYDTQGSAGKTRAITAGQNFKNIDAVIGPLRQENVEEAASELRNSDTPVFSPLSNKEIRIYKNLFQTLPSETMLQEGMLDYIATNGTEKNILLISDGKNMGQRDKITARIPWAKPVRVRKGNFMYPQDIAQNLDRQTDNWVIMASQDPGLVSTVVGLLNGLAGRNKLRLFTLDKNSAYDYHDVSNMSLAKLGFTFPSVNKSYDFKTPVPFTAQYKKRYGVLPNKYAVRGFDITYDVLLRLAAKGDVFKGINGEEETEYIENKFRYTKKLMAGYQNQSFYIIKYTKDLQFEVVK